MERPARRSLRRRRRRRGGTPARARLRGCLGAGSSGGTLRSHRHRHRRGRAGRHAGADQRPHGTDDPGRRRDWWRRTPFLPARWTSRWLVGVFLLAGLLQLALGVCRMGVYIRYVPYPVISGFMSGIGVIILVQQLFPLSGDGPAGLGPLVDRPAAASGRAATSTGAPSPSPRRRWRWSISCLGSPRSVPASLVALVTLTVAGSVAEARRTDDRRDPVRAAGARASIARPAAAPGDAAPRARARLAGSNRLTADLAGRRQPDAYPARQQP